MLDDILDLAADVLFGISARESLAPKTRRILEVIALLLGLTAMVLYIVLN